MYRSPECRRPWLPREIHIPASLGQRKTPPPPGPPNRVQRACEAAGSKIPSVAVLVGSLIQQDRDVPQRRYGCSFPSKAPSALILVEIEDRVTVLSNQGDSLGLLQILFHHLLYEFAKGNPRLPAKFALRLAGVSQKRFHFGRTIIARIHGNNDVPLFVCSLFFAAGSIPGDIHIEKARSKPYEFTNAVLLSRRDHVIPRLLLLEHSPLHLDIIARMTPVAESVHVAKIESILQAHLDARQPASNFTCHKRLAPRRRLMVEQDPITRVHSIGLAVIHRNPVRVKLRYSVWRARIERSC